MKTPGETRQKVKQVRYRHLKKRLEDRLQQVPENCLHNGEYPGCIYRACLYGLAENGWNGCVCDVRLDGETRAQNCSTYTPAVSKEDVREAFASFLQEAPLREIAYHYPDLAALLWVLDGDGPVRDVEEDEDFHTEEPPKAPASAEEGFFEQPETEPPKPTEPLPPRAPDGDKPHGLGGWLKTLFGGA